MVVTFGLTPAIQRVMVFGELTLDKVNRAVETHVCPAGKAVNAARAARIWLGECGGRVCVVGPVAGEGGRWCVERMRESGVGWDGVAVENEERVCVTVIDRAAGTVTELVQEARTPSSDEVAELLLRLELLAAPGGVLACCGTVAGADAGVYARAVRVWGERGGACAVIDGKGEVLLRALGEKGVAVRVAKINRAELEQTVGIGGGIEGLHAAGATHVVVTQGGEKVVASNGTVRMFFPPEPVRVVNTTGCGDCLAGVLAGELTRGGDFFAAVATAVRASALSAEDILPAVFEREKM